MNDIAWRCAKCRTHVGATRAACHRCGTPRRQPVFVIGQDGLVHEAEVHLYEDLSACDRVVALRRLARDARFFEDRMCPRCFQEVTDA